jgi:23S rRNA G2445 N2-methylase RlmL
MDKFRGLMIAPRGMEDVAVREIEELLKAKPEKRDMGVIFQVGELRELCRLCYLSQSASRILLLLDEFKISAKLEETTMMIGTRLEKLRVGEWASKETRFKVECRREGTHGFTSQALAEWLAGEIGKKIKQESKMEPVADLKEPNLIFYAMVVDENFYLGIDFAGFDVSKRDYKVMSHMPSIKGNIGYALLRISGYEKKQILLDPSSYSGVVPIEAALWASNRPVNYYRKTELHFTKFPNLKGIDFEKFFEEMDGKIKEKVEGEIHCLNSQFRYISSAKSNSKIAGVNKHIDFSRFDVEWLDTKFGKARVDVIAGNAPRISGTNGQIVEKYYTELFYQANFVLKKNGRLGLLCNNLEIIKAAALKNEFGILEERSIWQGEEELKVAVFEKRISK